ncbi:hypothetical protein V5O48_010436 [Marasmius crinis-equi]|uniref:FAD/NAD(P)-binding domain-containing protein n=1 Tax=Marasmius crinis-equi TaxID=585013 RepID=A0ABR3F8E7_9AGAR
MSPPNSTPEELDILIVGAGFAGLYQLQLYRKLGYKFKIFEAGSDIGGTWHWNHYPGARVDSPVPIYEYSNELLWKDWAWTEKYPGWQELRSYFCYIDKKLELKKDISLNTRVVGAEWNEDKDRWVVTTENGLTVHPRFLVLATGGLTVPYSPAFKGLDKFEGVCRHTARWPEEGVDVKGKRVAVVGTGASGVQVIQEIGPEVGHLTVFQRTPNLCLPMQQGKLDVATQTAGKKNLYPVIYRRRLQTFAGFIFHVDPTPYLSSSPEERILRFEDAWQRGGFESVFAFPDTATDDEVNDAVYGFWRSKVRERLRDSRMQEKLAPDAPPHPVGARRHSLEQSYYEVFNQDNVALIDLNENPIAEFTPKGIVTGDGQEHEFDVIVLATGFDAVTGAITNIDLRGVGGKTISEAWKNGVYTNLGMTVSGFPNMFFTYGPQAPTALSNGPSCVEPQGNWISECIQYMDKNNLTRIEATEDAQEAWRGLVMSIYDKTMMKRARGWWNGANIPGKVVELLSFPGGIPAYLETCKEKAEKGYEGFVLSSKSR